MLTALDVFSCIGCHAIGFDRAGIRTAALCEINPWRQLRLREHWPETPIYDDVRTAIPVRADIIIGGPPCQRTSVASAIHGYRTGESLWPHMLERGLDAGAEWFVVEQPPGNQEWEDAVSRDLACHGCHVARLEYGASDVGAPYPRRRVYLVACTSLSRLEVAWSSVPSEIAYVARAANARADWDTGVLCSLPVAARDAGEMDRGPLSRERRQWIEALGDSNPPHMAEVIGRAILNASASADRPKVVNDDAGGEVMRADDYDFYDEPIPDGYVLCPRCDGHMTVPCHCGGDLCVCENYGDEACPLCGGEYGGEGYVSKEKADRYLAVQAEIHAAFRAAVAIDPSDDKREA